MSKWREAFEEFMDNLYYDGYIYDIFISDPVKYQFELEEFLRYYEKHP